MKARLTARYAGSTASGMVLIQAAIPPGLEPATDDLEKLVARRQVAKFTHDGNQLTF